MAKKDLIPAYEFKPILELALADDDEEGYNPDTKTITPFSSGDADERSGYEYFDSITAATEAGLVDANNWPKQFFASRAVFNDFLHMLTEYEECYRISDRWYEAFMRLGQSADQEGFVSGREIASRFNELTRGLGNW